MHLLPQFRRLALGLILAGVCGGANALILQAGSNDLSNGVLSHPIALDITIDTVADLVTMTISGPTDRWFGIGLGVTTMSLGPYAIIASDAGVFEQDLGFFNAGDPVPVPAIDVLSDITVGPTRTVNLTRPINASYAGTSAGNGLGPYDFPTVDGATIELIWARSNVDTTFAYHGASGQNAGSALLSVQAVPIPGAIFLLGPAVAGLMLGTRRNSA